MVEKYTIKTFIRISFILFLVSGNLEAQEAAVKKNSNKPNLFNSLRFGQFTDGTISKKDFLVADKLILVSPFDTLFQISSFTLTRIREGESPIEAKNYDGCELTDAMRKIINSSEEGDKIFFEYIKGKSNDGAITSLGAMSFIIE